MGTSENITRAFERAGLPVEVATAPLVRSGRGTQRIVQLDIARRDRAERFRVWRGDPDNRVVGEGVDRRLRQLVLWVDEPRRRFELEVSPHVELPPTARVVRQVGRRKWIEQWTEARKRHYLCGMDESHLFIATLPRGVSTVRAAHEALRTPVLSLVERWAPRRTIRQGEWFFVALAPFEQAYVEAEVARGFVQRRVGIAQAARLGRAGRPHVADEVLVVVRRNHPGEILPVVIYVRGKVRHPDHRTVDLLAWRRAVPNAEPITTPTGLLWVD